MTKTTQHYTTWQSYIHPASEAYRYSELFSLLPDVQVIALSRQSVRFTFTAHLLCITCISWRGGSYPGTAST